MIDTESGRLPNKVFTMNPTSSFVLIHIISQAAALQKYVSDWSKKELIAWLEAQGKLEKWTDIFGNEVFSFESPARCSAIFYLQETRFIFVGDNTMFSF
jgi:hypothetical protein